MSTSACCSSFQELKVSHRRRSSIGEDHELRLHRHPRPRRSSSDDPLFQHLVATYARETNKTASMWRAIPDDHFDYKARLMRPCRSTVRMPSSDLRRYLAPPHLSQHVENIWVASVRRLHSTGDQVTHLAFTFWLDASQTFTVPSTPVEAILLPSGAKARLTTALECPLRVRVS